MTPTLTFAAMVVAVGGLLIIDGGVRHASAGQRMPVMAVAGGFAMLWAYELNVQLIGALTGEEASTLIALLPAVVLLTLPVYIVAAMDIGRERMRLSRTAAMRTLILLGAAAYLIVIALTGAVARASAAIMPNWRRRYRCSWRSAPGRDAGIGAIAGVAVGNDFQAFLRASL
jgi:hypothetical protein